MVGAVIRIFLGIAVALYPVAVYFGLKAGAHAWLGLGLIAIGILRLWISTTRKTRVLAEVAMAAVLFCFGTATLVFGSGDLLLYYPVVMSLGAFSIFALSIISPPSLIERFARLREPNLPPEGVRYCRRVTLVWCAFLICNAGIAAWTVVEGDQRLWLYYNGFLSYLLMGALFVGEFVVRTLLRGKVRNA